jgi:ATP-dependent DNA helicase RecG
VVTLKKALEAVAKGAQKTVEKTVVKSVEKTVEIIFGLIKTSPQITQKEIMDKTGLTRRGVEWNLKKLRDEGRIRRVGPDKGGHWEVIS